MTRTRCNNSLFIVVFYIMLVYVDSTERKPSESLSLRTQVLGRQECILLLYLYCYGRIKKKTSHIKKEVLNRILSIKPVSYS